LQVDSRGVDTEERSRVRNFEMTCYYVAPNLPAQFGAEQAARADNAEFEK
jgi:hypothetical protein